MVQPSRQPGSTTLLTDQSGDEAGRVQYSPYGTIIDNTLAAGVTDRLYTGQRWEDGIELYDYRARFYDPWVGSFISPDTIVPEPGNPLAFNRYAYVNNNPIRNNDPSGHCWGFASGIRNWGYGQTCENLDMAIAIAGNPEASAYDRATAVAYTEAVAISHLYLAIGAGLLVCGTNPTCAAMGGAGGTAGTSLAQNSHNVEQGLKLGVKAVAHAASADGDPTNEARLANRIIESEWTVLGKNPGYIPKAKDLGANFLHMESGWDWDKNVKFLDDAIARNHSFYLETSFVRGVLEGPSSPYVRELEHIIRQGYEWVTLYGQDWLVRIP